MANEEIEQLMRQALEVALYMRRNQKQFFASKGKDKQALFDAKRLEAALDMRLAELGIK